ncbi:MAG: hypothetical protein WDO70_02475 [Alphaproteobacteria bacterium]
MSKRNLAVGAIAASMLGVGAAAIWIAGAKPYIENDEEPGVSNIGVAWPRHNLQLQFYRQTDGSSHWFGMNAYSSSESASNDWSSRGFRTGFICDPVRPPSHGLSCKPVVGLER